MVLVEGSSASCEQLALQPAALLVALPQVFALLDELQAPLALPGVAMVGSSWTDARPITRRKVSAAMQVVRFKRLVLLACVRRKLQTHLKLLCPLCRSAFQCLLRPTPFKIQKPLLDCIQRKRAEGVCRASCSHVCGYLDHLAKIECVAYFVIAIREVVPQPTIHTLLRPSLLLRKADSAEMYLG